jgi:hypothetical protein
MSERPFESEEAYREAVGKLREEQAKLLARRRQLETMGLRPDQVERAMGPLLGFTQRLAERIAQHEAAHGAAPGGIHDLARLLAEVAEGPQAPIGAERLASLRAGAFREATLAEAEVLLAAAGVRIRVERE